MTPNVSDEALRYFERGLNAVFTADTVSQVLAAVDVEALLAGEDLDDPMDYEQMGEVVGQLAGRLVVKRTIGRVTPGQFAEQTVGYAVGGAVGRKGVEVLIRQNPEAVVREVRRELEGRSTGYGHRGPADVDRRRTDGSVEIEIEGEEPNDESTDESADESKSDGS